MDEAPCSLQSLENKVCNIFAEPINSDEEMSKKILRKRLLAAVQKHKELYDPRHKHFSNIAIKNESWKKISEKLNIDVEVCRNTWFNMRITFQKSVRILHPVYRLAKKARLRKILRTIDPKMYFLWPFVNKVSDSTFRSYNPDCRRKERTDIQENKVDKSEDVIIVDTEPEIIDLGESDDDHEKAYSTISQAQHHLVNLIRSYPELYNKQNNFYNDYQRKCIVWYDISKEINDKATKLIKSWIHLVTRYEWELVHIQRMNTPMQQLLGFLRPYIYRNDFTVYKLSYYLKKEWYEIIKSFRDICRFVEIIKSNIEVVSSTETLIKKFTLHEGNFDKSYVEMWEKLSKETSWSAGTCEVTWLTLRVFFEEISDMRKVGYKFQDKWFFEAVMAEIMCIVRVKNATESLEQTKNHSVIRMDQAEHRDLPQDASCSNFLKTSFVETTTASTPSYQPDSITSTTIHLPARDLSDQVDTTSLISCTTNHISPNRQVHLPDINQMITVTEPSNMSPPPITLVDSGTISYGPQDFEPVPNYDPLTNTESRTKNTSNLNQTPLEIWPSETQTVEDQINMPVPDHQIPHISSTLQANNLNNISQNPLPARVSLPNSSLIHTEKSQMNTSLPDYQIPHISSTLQPINLNYSTTSIPDPSRNFNKNLAPPNHQIPHITSTLQAINLNSTQPLKDVHMLQAVTYAQQLNSSLPEQQIPHISSSLQPMQSKNSIQANLVPRTEVRDSFSVLNDKLSTPVNNAKSVEDPLFIDLTDEKQSSNEMDSLERSSYITTIKQNINEVRFILTINTGLLIVQRPPLVEKSYSLSIPKVGSFVREVMSIPQLLIQKSTNLLYWRHIEEKFDMPIRICQACWKFLSNHTDFFHLFGPMDELLKPSKNDKDFWKTSYILFREFDERAVKKGWLKYLDDLPAAIKRISQYPSLFVSSTSNTSHIWKDIVKDFPGIPNLPEIWCAFRDVYTQYLLELENGIQNKWPLKWWRILMSLQFLLKEKYQRLEPMYFIILNKVNEEIERCIVLEKKVLGIQNDKMNSVEAFELIKHIRSYSAIYLPKYSAKEKAYAWNEVAKTMKFPVEVCMMRFCSAYRQFRMFVAQDTEKRCIFNKQYFSNMQYIHDCVNEERLSKIKIRTPLEVNSSIDPNIKSNNCELQEVSQFDPTSNKALEEITNVLGRLSAHTKLDDRVLGIINKYIKH